MIISIIDSIVTTMNADPRNDDFCFGHGQQYFSNILNDEKTFPCIFLDQPIENDYQLNQGGYIGETYTIKIFFMYKSELDWLPTDHDVNCIQPANQAIRDFISTCQASTLIDSISTASAIEYINLLDVNVSGKILTVTIVPTINKEVCV